MLSPSALRRSFWNYIPWLVCVGGLFTPVRSAPAEDPAAPHWLLGQAYHIPSQYTNQESGYFSIIEGQNGRVYIGAAKYGVDAYLIEFDPKTAAMKMVVDVHKVIGSTATGFAAQAKIHTRNNVGASGKIWFGSKQGYPERNEQRSDYPGGYVMSYDPKTDKAEHFGIAKPQHGIISVTPDEGRGLVYVSTCADDRPMEHSHFMILDLAKRTYRDLGDTEHLYAFIVLDHQGRAYHPKRGGSVLRYDPTGDRLDKLSVTVDDKPAPPALTKDEAILNWEVSPDRKTLYAVEMSTNQLFAFDLTAPGETLQGRQIGELLAGVKKTDCRALCVGADSGVWAAVSQVDAPEGQTCHLVGYRPGQPAPRDLGPAGIANPDYTPFTDKDGKPLPWHHAVRKAKDGTLTPWVPLGICAAKDGTVYVLTLAPFTLLRFGPEVLRTASAAEPRRADVVVYGATASGVIAAVAAAREGKTVLLLEPGQHLGGMVSGGLGATDTGNRAAIGGYSREFFDRVREHYVKKYGADSAQVKDCSGGFHFEPHVAEQIFKEMLHEAKVEVLFGQRLDKLLPLAAGPIGKRIAGFTTIKGDEFRAAVWIDASYEGDLMARAGVRYTIGREGREEYKESIAGVQAHSPAHQWPVKISPFVESENAEAKTLLPFVQPGPAGEAGAADKKAQAYNFRLCMTDSKDNQVPFPKPSGYDPKRYELLARYLAMKPGLKVGQLMNPVRMPNGKTDTNNNGAFSTDHLGANWDYPDADYATRERIWKDHVEYVQGFCYFLANDPRVPEALHKEMATWGLAKDEFLDTDHWPHQLYVREARRMLGAYFMTQADIMEQRLKADSVGLGSYNTDSHHVQRVSTADGAVLNEGDFQVHVSPYAIPYRCLVPRSAECENLLVPVCLSASHVAYGTIRMEPVYMILGQASGVAAALALDNKTAVQNVPIEKLLDKLKGQKAVLSPEGLGGSTGGANRLEAAKLGGIVVDDVDAKKVGDWKGSSAVGPYVGDGYLHDDNQNKGKMSVRFTPKLPEAGRYEVCIVYSANPNRATNTPVLIHHADGEQSMRVNQRLPLKDDKPVRLGVFAFAAGDQGWVEVRNDDTDGHVVADAVQFVLVR